MPADDPPSRRWFLAYKIEAAILVLLATAAFGAPFAERYIGYVGGTHNSRGDGFFAFMVMCELLVFTGAVFVLWAVVQLLFPPYTDSV